MSPPQSVGIFICFVTFLFNEQQDGIDRYILLTFGGKMQILLTVWCQNKSMYGVFIKFIVSSTLTV